MNRTSDTILTIQTRTYPREWNAKNLLEFLDSDGSPSPGQKTRSDSLQQKENMPDSELR